MVWVGLAVFGMVLVAAVVLVTSLRQHPEWFPVDDAYIIVPLKVFEQYAIHRPSCAVHHVPLEQRAPTILDERCTCGLMNLMYGAKVKL